jgi:hypothetical protein
LKGAYAFDARKLMAKAEMDPSPKGDVPVRSSLEVEPLCVLFPNSEIKSRTVRGAERGSPSRCR